jgi:hypothetical protein
MRERARVEGREGSRILQHLEIEHIIDLKGVGKQQAQTGDPLLKFLVLERHSSSAGLLVELLALFLLGRQRSVVGALRSFGLARRSRFGRRPCTRLPLSFALDLD